MPKCLEPSTRQAKRDACAAAVDCWGGLSLCAVCHRLVATLSLSFEALVSAENCALIDFILYFPAFLGKFWNLHFTLCL